MLLILVVRSSLIYTHITFQMGLFLYSLVSSKSFLFSSEKHVFIVSCLHFTIFKYKQRRVHVMTDIKHRKDWKILLWNFMKSSILFVLLSITKGMFIVRVIRRQSRRGEGRERDEEMVTPQRLYLPLLCLWPLTSHYRYD